MTEMKIRENNFKRIEELGERVYLFGAGYWANRYLDYVGSNVIKKINGVIVSDVKNNPPFFRNIPVIDKNSKTLNVNDVIIVAVENNEEIIRELKQKKFEKIIPIQKAMPVISEKDEAKILSRDHEVRRYINFFYNKLPIFNLISIETINRCNGDCSFCPVNKNEPQRKYSKMSTNLFKKIIDELSELKYTGIIGLFGNNEPFLDNRIEEFARYAREKNPDAFIYIKTNGTLVTMERFQAIIPFLDVIGFDDYQGKGMPENIKKIEDYCIIENIKEKFYYEAIDKDLIRASRGGDRRIQKYTIQKK